ncbi:MAG: ketoacyl-ACP synthase III [Verrucomicrobia bacterium]|nr:ketoacyl-ACP synthase III [Verrucomicrobiota bacterium]MBS0647074.1 ketoacyl-ACP synthase III [Verrucomicrobiota bacterium]
MTRRARITGLGSYLPERVLTNQDLEKIVETSDEWIFSRTGMKERRLAAENEYTSDMGAKAAFAALKDANLKSEEVGMILVATSTPDYVFPSTAALIQHQLKALTIPALDIQAACTGFLYGLACAKAFVESGLYNHILVIATEKLSSVVNYKDRTTCVLFGDGAAAVVVSNQGEGFEIKEICLGADGEAAELLMLPAGGSRFPASEQTVASNMHYIKMEGQEVFKHAVRRMEMAANDCLQKANLPPEAIDWIIPHQANERIIDAIAKRFGVGSERVFKTVHKYGNTSASSIAIALDELVKQKDILVGQNLLLVAFGAGFTWGATILTKQKDL